LVRKLHFLQACTIAPANKGLDLPDIKHLITIDAPAEYVLKLVTSGAGFAQWWAADVTDDVASGEVELAFFNRATTYRFRPLRTSPPPRTEWHCVSGKEWDGTRLLFDIEQKEEHSVLRFTHAGWRVETDYFLSCNTTWGVLMFRLKAAGEGKKPGPLFTHAGLQT